MRISDWRSDLCSSDRAARRDTGWQPYRIRIGDQWYSYQRFEPISLLAGVASDFADLGNYMTPEESDRFALNLSIAVAKNITSKTWLSGLSDFFDVLSDPERYGRNYVARLAGSRTGERRVGKEGVRTW